MTASPVSPDTRRATAEHTPTTPEQFAELRHQVRDFTAALESRAKIDQAIGITMARHRCDGASARETLIRVSQHTNVKLRDIAQALNSGVTEPLPEHTPRALRRAVRMVLFPGR